MKENSGEKYSAVNEDGGADSRSLVMSGYLYKRGGFFKNKWNRRYVELRSDNTIYMSILKGGIIRIAFNLGYQTRCEDCLARDFCIKIYQSDSGQSLYLAAENISIKETWTEAIHSTLSKIRLAQRKSAHKDRKIAEARNQYISRPVIYVKVIRARSLFSDGKSDGSSINPFVKVALGASTAKTITRKNTNNPEWGMVFSFDWDRNMRYVKIEVCNDEFASESNTSKPNSSQSQNSRLLGVVHIPILCLTQSNYLMAWYPLGKKSSKSMGAYGEVEVEIACTGLPDQEQLPWLLFREVQKLSDFTMNVAAKADGAGQIALTSLRSDFSNSARRTATSTQVPAEMTTPIFKSDMTIDTAALPGKESEQFEEQISGFPLHFPSIEVEVLEDVSLHVSLVSSINGSKVSSPGVLLLTNFRLIFVSLIRIIRNSGHSEADKLQQEDITLSGDGNGDGTNAWNLDHEAPLQSSREVDLSLQIPIFAIINVSMTSEADTEVAGTGGYNDAIRIKTNDFRTVHFIFREVEVAENTSSNEAITSYVHDAVDEILHRSEAGFKPPRHARFSRSESMSSRANSIDIARRSPNVTSDRRSSASTPLPSFGKGFNRLGSTSVDTYGCLLAGKMVSTLQVCWARLAREHPYIVEALDSEEGPPVERMYRRLKFSRVNRFSGRLSALYVHRALITAIHMACDQQESNIRNTMMPKDDDVHNCKNEEDTTTRPSNLTYLISQSPHLPLGWAAPDEKGVQQSEADLVRDYSTTSALNERIANSPILGNAYRKLLFNLAASWRMYDPVSEFKRMGVPNSKWRITHINDDYRLCSTYPSILSVPHGISDETIAGSSGFRSKGRFPTLCWLSSRTGASICRSSQPLVGLSNSRNSDDEDLIQAIQECCSNEFESHEIYRSAKPPSASMSSNLLLDDILISPTPYESHPQQKTRQRPYIIVDARPLLNAKANQAVGKGVESTKAYGNVSVIFMDIANIHVARKSLDTLEETASDENLWLRNLEASGWMNHVHKILLAATKIAHCVGTQRLSVLVHCSDGWDRTAQLTSLSMLLLDGYYRTLAGFIVLIEKEWVSFGHKFADRSGCIEGVADGWKDDERSPIFQLFLDCVHQCVAQMPNSFEFNQNLLLFLMEYFSCGWFANFMFNSERELNVHLKESLGEQHEDPCAISIWAIVLANTDIFTNTSYVAEITPQSNSNSFSGSLINSITNQNPLYIVASKSKLVVWSEWFLRWNDKLWGAMWLENISQQLKGAQQNNTRKHKNSISCSVQVKSARGFSVVNDVLNFPKRVPDMEYMVKWVDDKSSSSCMSCSRRFSLIWRRHHCRCCGLLFCENCSKDLRIIPSISTWRPSRCCSNCVKIIDLADGASSKSLSHNMVGEEKEEF